MPLNGFHRDHLGTSVDTADTAVPYTAFRVYARASTAAQKATVRKQLEAAESDLHARGLLPPDVRLPRRHCPEAGVFVDEDRRSRGAPLELRPGAVALLEDLKHHRCSSNEPGLLWVWARSRMYRNNPGNVLAHIQGIEALGWQLYDHRAGRVVQVTGHDGLFDLIVLAFEAADHYRSSLRRR